MARIISNLRKALKFGTGGTYGNRYFINVLQPICFLISYTSKQILTSRVPNSNENLTFRGFIIVIKIPVIEGLLNE
jgi:hypothetical protein